MQPPSTSPAREAEIGLCVLLAAADGDVSDREIGALSSRLGKILGDEFSVMALGAIVEAEITKMSALGPDRYVRTLVERLPPARRAVALRGALVIASSDGLAPEEEQMFRDVAAELGITPDTAERLLDDVAKGLPPPPST